MHNFYSGDLLEVAGIPQKTPRGTSVQTSGSTSFYSFSDFSAVWEIAFWGRRYIFFGFKKTETSALSTPFRTPRSARVFLDRPDLAGCAFLASEIEISPGGALEV